MSTITETCVEFCKSHRGESFADLRTEIANIDWTGYYPVVDADGNLTGELCDATGENDMVIVSIGEDGIPEITGTSLDCDAAVSARLGRTIGGE